MKYTKKYFMACHGGVPATTYELYFIIITLLLSRTLIDSFFVHRRDFNLRVNIDVYYSYTLSLSLSHEDDTQLRMLRLAF